MSRTFLTWLAANQYTTKKRKILLYLRPTSVDLSAATMGQVFAIRPTQHKPGPQDVARHFYIGPSFARGPLKNGFGFPVWVSLLKEGTTPTYETSDSGALAQERVAEDEKRPPGGRHIHAHQSDLGLDQSAAPGPAVASTPWTSKKRSPRRICLKIVVHVSQEEVPLKEWLRLKEDFSKHSGFEAPKFERRFLKQIVCVFFPVPR